MSAFAHIWRLLQAGFTLARYDVAVPPALAPFVPPPVRLLGHLSRAFAKPHTSARNDLPTEQSKNLADALTALGPAYIKLGQFLATRPDILGPELAADLRVLQDKLPPFPTEAAMAVVEEELGRKVLDVFDSFSPPIAAASIAQVHKARLKGEDGPFVAVKILRPDIEKAFARDLSAFAFAARQIERFNARARRLEPVKLVETLAASVRLELDLRLEAAAASEVAEHMRSDAEFVVPETFWQLTTKRMLTTSWIDGIPLDDHAALEAAGLSKKELARELLTIFLKQALRDGLFHADMHPGNLFALPPQTEDEPPRIAAVDYGIVGRLDRSMQRFMAETLYGFITRDYRRIAEAHFEVGFVGGAHQIDEFAQALRAIGEPVFGRTVRDISMARLLAQLFEVTRLFDMRLQPQLVLLQKTMVVVEGVARSLDPDLDIWETARPIVETWMSRELGPEMRLQEAAQAAASLVRVAARAPHVLEQMEAAAGQLSSLSTGEGLKLHPDSERAIAEYQFRSGRNWRIALWVGAAAALAALVITAV
jgi:ubiquinone biosynthesis protein